jgi:hypothetical protein
MRAVRRRANPACCAPPDSRRTEGFLLGYLWSTIAVTALLAGAHARDRIGRLGRAVWWVLAAFTTALAAVRLGRLVVLRLTVPNEWDYLAFWECARVATRHQNFYDPSLYQNFPLPLQPSAGYLKEIHQVGYGYPPTSMLLMFPFGWFSYSTAYALWDAASFVALALALVVLWRRVTSGGAIELALVITLALAAPWTRDTVSLGQTNFFALLALSLALAARDRPWSGAWLALAVVAKPTYVLATPWFVFRRHWRGAAVAAIALALLGLASVALFGASTCAAYFRDHVVSRFPHYMYTQSVNASLLAATLRGLHVHALGQLRTALPIFGAVALLLGTATAWAAWRGGIAGAAWSFTAAWLLALLIYPSSLNHYSVVLLPPLLALWTARARAPGGAAFVIALIAVVYALHAWPRGEAVLIARLLVWGVLVVMALRAPAAAAERQAPPVLQMSASSAG